MVQHPFSGVDPEIIKGALQEKAKEEADRFPTLINRVQQLFREVYPLHLIAVISQYGLMAFVGDDGVDTIKTGNKIDQHHVEILMAISLTVDSQQWGQEPANPTVVQETMDLVGDLTDAFHFKRLVGGNNNTDEQECTVAMLQEKLRVHTQMVRNWSNFSGVVAISKELYGALDHPFRDAHGFSATEAILVLETATRSYEKRLNDKFQRLRKVLRERNRNRVARKLNELFPEIVGNAEAWVKSMPADLPRDELQTAIIDLTDRLTFLIALVNCDEIASETQLNAKTVRLILLSLSHEYDALLSQDLEHLFLENPIWSSPFLHNSGSFYCPVPHAAFSHIHRIMRRLADKAGAAENLSDARARYLEAKIEETIKSALPTSKITTGVKWKIGNKTYETDLIAVLDQTVLIMEAKSGALTPQGLRGAPERVRRHVRDLVEEPALQSTRLQQEILKAKSGDKVALVLAEGLGIDAKNTEAILRLSITLDDFSVLSSSELELKEAGWIPKDLSLPPTLNVADLVSVCHILDEPAFLLHYFSERDRVQKTNITADELDFLGFYLETGFNTTAITDDETNLILTGMSSVVDRYYNSLDAGVAVPKPRPKIHPELLKLIKACQQRGVNGWTLLCPTLLGIGNIDEQKRLFKGLEHIRKNVRKKFRDPKHDCAVGVEPPDYREYAFVFHIYPDALSEGRNAAMTELAQEAMEEQGRQKCIVVSKKLEEWHRPYSCIAMLSQPDEM